MLDEGLLERLDKDPEVRKAGRSAVLRRAVAELAPQYREVVVLRHYEGLKFREIGDVLGIPEGTVKSRLAEALAQLNRRLNHLNEDLVCNHKNHQPALRTR